MKKDRLDVKSPTAQETFQPISRPHRLHDSGQSRHRQPIDDWVQKPKTDNHWLLLKLRGRMLLLLVVLASVGISLPQVTDQK